MDWEERVKGSAVAGKGWCRGHLVWRPVLLSHVCSSTAHPLSSRGTTWQMSQIHPHLDHWTMPSDHLTDVAHRTQGVGTQEPLRPVLL